MLQETESQASNTTEQVKEESEEEINESNRDHKRLRGRPKSNGTINANKEWSDEEIFLLIDARKEILSSVFWLRSCGKTISNDQWYTWIIFRKYYLK